MAGARRAGIVPQRAAPSRERTAPGIELTASRAGRRDCSRPVNPSAAPVQRGSTTRTNCVCASVATLPPRRRMISSRREDADPIWKQPTAPCAAGCAQPSLSGTPAHRGGVHGLD